MILCRYSRLAIASILLNLPFLVAMPFFFLKGESSCVPILNMSGQQQLTFIILWICISFLAIGLSFRALNDIRSSNRKLQGRWMAILGLILSHINPLIGLFVAGFR